MLKNNNLGPLLVILTVLVAVLVGYRLSEKRSLGLPPNFTLVSELQNGKAIAGFPTGLIDVVTDATITKSAKYRVDENGKTSEIITTSYRTEAAMDDLFAVYVDYFNSNGYTILKTGTTSGLSTIEAGNREHTVSVSIYLSGTRQKEVRIDVRSVIQ